MYLFMAGCLVAIVSGIFVNVGNYGLATTCALISIGIFIWSAKLLEIKKD